MKSSPLDTLDLFTHFEAAGFTHDQAEALAYMFYDEAQGTPMTNAQQERVLAKSGFTRDQCSALLNALRLIRAAGSKSLPTLLPFRKASQE